jgi:hypothetical protein
MGKSGDERRGEERGGKGCVISQVWEERTETNKSENDEKPSAV